MFEEGKDGCSWRRRIKNNCLGLDDIGDHDFLFEGPDSHHWGDHVDHLGHRLVGGGEGGVHVLKYRN